jgi:hypothetical protein
MTSTAYDDQFAPDPLTVEDAVDRRDALAERAVAEMVHLSDAFARDLISDLLAAELDLDRAIREHIRAMEALRT